MIKAGGGGDNAPEGWEVVEDIAGCDTALAAGEDGGDSGGVGFGEEEVGGEWGLVGFEEVEEEREFGFEYGVDQWAFQHQYCREGMEFGFG